MEYPDSYTVTRLDMRNDQTARYTDVGLRVIHPQEINSMREISVYIWPVDPSASTVAILDDLLDRAENIFDDFMILEQYSTMIDDMEGQAAVFSWTASPATATIESEGKTLPLVSRIVCFRNQGLAWEIHVASDSGSQKKAADEFNHILKTFRLLN